MLPIEEGNNDACKWFVCIAILCATVSPNAFGATPEVDIANGLPLCRRANVNLNLNRMPNLSLVSSSAGGASIYQSGFDSSTWSGSLKKIMLVSDAANGQMHLAAEADWDAGETLTGTSTKAADPEAGMRNIFMGITNADSSGNKLSPMVEFKWEKLSAAQRALFNASPITGKSDGLGERRLNYLRGTRNLELGRSVGIFRARDRVLGDIINSKPVYVGDPAAGVQGARYQKFYDDHQERIAAVYIGANDGMLHAFDAAKGRELFAYIPAPVIPRMNQLTSPHYAHRPYTDGEIGIGEAWLRGEWKTILAAGMGGGAQGLFALDITNPAEFAGGMGAVFEFSDSDDVDIGNLVGAPVIAKFKTSITKGIAEYKYFIVVPSGLNNYRDDGVDRFDTAASSALFLLSLDKGVGEKWKQGVNYYKFKVPISESSQQNGLSAPALVAGSDGAVRYAYAGDLQGNMWRFDFTASAPWRGALGASPNTPLFTAKSSSGTRQPITTQPTVVFAPGGGYVVLFGTGKFIEQADAAPANFRSQSFYGIYDSTHEVDKVSSRKQLAQRMVITDAANAGGQLTITGNAFDYGVTNGRKQGWYFDFFESDKTGERSASGAVVEQGQLFFNSLMPSGDPCGAGGGRSYRLDALTGLPIEGKVSGLPSQVGMMAAPLFVEAATVQTSARNALGKRIVKRKQAAVNFGGGVRAAVPAAPDSAAEVAVVGGRTSWREVFNWQELRDAAKKR